MAGNFRTSFQFTETAGFTDAYTPPRPYFSWGTEQVAVIEDTEEFISLQHTLVMYFQDESGEVTGPLVMKHWRLRRLIRVNLCSVVSCRKFFVFPS